MSKPIAIEALTFDTGGTILDWHGGLVRAFDAVAARRGAQRDWPAFVNEYRRRTLQGMVNQVRPAFNFDDVHARVLDEMCAEQELGAFTAADRDGLWRTMHALDAWPDFPPALRRIRARYPVVSFTLLSTALVVAVSRCNKIEWDAVFSCEMIGIYKTRPESYLTAAKWLALPPDKILMVACHNFDLAGARAAGFRTAFVRRPHEWGPAGPPDPDPHPDCDIVADTFDELASKVGA
jgi:2-haloacid dehalogenase